MRVIDDNCNGADSLSYIILSSGFDGLGFVFMLFVESPFMIEGVRRGSKKLTPQCRCLTNPGK